MRILHTMLRVGDLQRSIDFYTGVMGMTLLRTTERPDQQYDLAFVGYGSNPELKEAIAVYDAAAVIARTGISGEYEICVKALDMFVSLLGSQAGDAVLSYLATGGMYLGGGIPPKILSKLQDGTLVEAYLKKGRMSPLVESTPLYVIKDDHAALLGAATIAVKLLSK